MLVWLARRLGRFQERAHHHERTRREYTRRYTKQLRARQEVDVALRHDDERKRLRRKFSRTG